MCLRAPPKSEPLTMPLHIVKYQHLYLRSTNAAMISVVQLLANVSHTAKSAMIYMLMK